MPHSKQSTTPFELPSLSDIQPSIEPIASRDLEFSHASYMLRCSMAQLVTLENRMILAYDKLDSTISDILEKSSVQDIATAMSLNENFVRIGDDMSVLSNKIIVYMNIIKRYSYAQIKEDTILVYRTISKFRERMDRIQYKFDLVYKMIKETTPAVLYSNMRNAANMNT